MSTASEPTKILETSIEEQRRTYANVSNIYDQLRIKALALLSGEVAIVAFLFTNWNFWKLVVGGDRMFFLFTGIVLLGLAFALLLWIISTVKWMMPHDSTPAHKWLSDKNYPDHHSFLEYLHDDYIKANAHCEKIVSNRCRKFNWSIFLLAGGVIIIMVIKFGGPQI